MKATKKQIAEVTALAIEEGINVDEALKTLSLTSVSIYKAIGAKGVIRTTKRVLSPDYVDTMELARKASKLGVNVSELMTARQISVNQF